MQYVRGTIYTFLVSCILFGVYGAVFRQWEQYFLTLILLSIIYLLPIVVLGCLFGALAKNGIDNINTSKLIKVLIFESLACLYGVVINYYLGGSGIGEIFVILISVIGASTFYAILDTIKKI